ncbi:MAG TPA: Crp/Fnr family transcriptional regulator [Terriglobia bacterium]|nr:Crp/Fnr family transcriptional regulator [Terriglobia bacterium]
MKSAQVRQSGERTNPAGRPVSNKILLSLPDDEYGQIRAHLEFVQLEPHHVLHEPGEKLRFAYFFNSGLASLLAATREGKAVEAGVVGSEGIVGTALAVGLLRTPLRAVVQIGGDGFKINGTALQARFRTLPELQMRLSRYAVLQGMQAAQTAACNRLHELRRRFARWILMAQDRVNAGTLPLTHDFLANMLGTDRPSVSRAASALQNRKVIRYSRGVVEILDRKRLESCACECYRIIQEFNGDLGLV